MQEHHAQVGKSATLELFATYAIQYVVQYVTKSTIMAAHMDRPPLGVLHALPGPALFRRAARAGRDALLYCTLGVGT